MEFGGVEALSVGTGRPSQHSRRRWPRRQPHRGGRLLAERSLLRQVGELARPRISNAMWRVSGTRW